MRVFLAAVILASLSVAALAETIRTKSWFRDHPAERQQVLKYCYDDPGTARRNANCLNAEAAQSDTGIDQATAEIRSRDGQGLRHPTAAHLGLSVMQQWTLFVTAYGYIMRPCRARCHG